MKLFQLISLTSKDKIEAEGILFFDGKVVVRWLSDVSSIVIHDNLNNFRKVSVPKGYRAIKFISSIHYFDDTLDENGDQPSENEEDENENDKLLKKSHQEFEELKVDRFSHWQNKIDQINRFRFANNKPKIKDEELLNYLEKHFKPAYSDF